MVRVGEETRDLTGPPERLRAFGPTAATVTVASRLNAPRQAVWRRVNTAAGINDEMRPVMRMTMPAGIERLDQLAVGQPIGRSWILLGGVLPFDYDDLMLARLDDGTEFVERSHMASQRLWEHVRTLSEDEGGCLLTDRLTWEPRLGLPGVALRPSIRWFFEHRHSRLRRRFGGTTNIR